MAIDPQNPYAAPEAQVLEALPVTASEHGAPQDWRTGEVIGAAWELFKSQWAQVLPAFLVFFLAIAVGGGVLAAVIGRVVGEGLLGVVVVQVLTNCASAFLTLGFTRFLLATIRREPSSIGQIFGGGDRFLVALATNIIQILAIAVGLVLLVVPGLMLAYGTLFASTVVADSNFAPVDALKRSWELTDGHKLRLLGFFLALAAFNLVGLLACGVGLLATAPTSVLALDIIYTRLTGTGPKA